MNNVVNKVNVWDSLVSLFSALNSWLGFQVSQHPVGLFAVLSSFVPLSLLIILGLFHSPRGRLGENKASELIDILKGINNMNILRPISVCKKSSIRQVRCEDLQGLVGVVGRICRSFVISWIEIINRIDLRDDRRLKNWCFFGKLPNGLDPPVLFWKLYFFSRKSAKYA